MVSALTGGSCGSSTDFGGATAGLLAGDGVTLRVGMLTLAAVLNNGVARADGRLAAAAAAVGFGGKAASPVGRGAGTEAIFPPTPTVDHTFPVVLGVGAEDLFSVTFFAAVVELVSFSLLLFFSSSSWISFMVFLAGGAPAEMPPFVAVAHTGPLDGASFPAPVEVGVGATVGREPALEVGNPQVKISTSSLLLPDAMVLTGAGKVLAEAAF